MNSVAKSMVSAFVAVGLAVACGGTPAVPQGIIASNVQPAQMGPTVGKGCISPEQFVWIPQTASNPQGPDTSNSSLIVETGTGDVTIACSVIPQGANGGPPYTVNLQAVISGGSAPATLTLGPSTFAPRVRDANGNPTTAGDSTQMPGIIMDYLDPTKHLRETDCVAQYVLANDGEPGTSLTSVADTFADNNGGRIWVSVFCPSPTNEDETMKPGNAGCQTSATFRFENCTSKM